MKSYIILEKLIESKIEYKMLEEALELIVQKKDAEIISLSKKIRDLQLYEAANKPMKKGEMEIQSL